MQAKVGIVRLENEMQEALDGLKKLWARAGSVGVHGHREYNPGWHTALDLGSMLTVSEATTLSAIERKESRGGHYRDDCPNKLPEYAKFNVVVGKASDGSMKLRHEPLAPMPDYLKQIIEEMK